MEKKLEIPESERETYGERYAVKNTQRQQISKFKHKQAICLLWAVHLSAFITWCTSEVCVPICEVKWEQIMMPTVSSSSERFSVVC